MSQIDFKHSQNMKKMISRYNIYEQEQEQVLGIHLFLCTEKVAPIFQGFHVNTKILEILI